ncbi:hypothetical protein ABGB16_11655 [Micromonospora sp. B11E3]|uniref:hypothetical protein n=1 Tax=Micromonospora sp. B11E3 TaxID=3153562 RepID=UPI00325E0D91
MRDVSLVAPTVTGPARMPAHLDRLSIHLADGTDQQVAGMRDEVAQLSSLSLRGTPVSDAIVPVLARYDLDRLDLVDTAVTAPALSRFRAEHRDQPVSANPGVPRNRLTIHDSTYGRPETMWERFIVRPSRT